MAEGEEKHHHHHLFHRHKEEDAVEDPEKELKHHKHVGTLSKITAVAAGAYAVHEKHKAKKDPENEHHHKKAEAIAATVAVGAGGLAFHEHHEKKEAKEKLKEERHGHY